MEVPRWCITYVNVMADIEDDETGELIVAGVPLDQARLIVDAHNKYATEEA